MIDLRSDTVTRPSEEMLKAMFSANVGDDVFGEDDEVNELEERVAKLFGKEAGLFCPSGTMTNQIAIKIHTQPGDEVICDKTAHIYNYEGGGMAVNSMVSVKLMNGERGVFSEAQLSECVNVDDIHFANSSLVSIENTVNKGGGKVWSLKEMEAISKLAIKNNLKIHLDGARVFNAIVAAEYSTNQVGELFDTLSICLSKGLGCPVGSLLIGDKNTIKAGRRIRKRMGGGMRQAGYLAKAGLYALDNNINRLKEDHTKAKRLEQALQTLKFANKVYPVETNIVIFELNHSIQPNEFIAFMEQQKIKLVGMGEGKIRLVTHLDITPNMIDHIIDVLERI